MESTGNLSIRFKGCQEYYPCSQIPAPQITQRGWDELGNRKGPGDWKGVQMTPGSSFPCTTTSRKAPGPRPHGPTAPGVDLSRHRTRCPDATPSSDHATLPPPPALADLAKAEGSSMGGTQAGLGRTTLGRGSGTWGRQEGIRRPRYLLILCAKARRSAAAMAPHVPTQPLPRAPSGSWTPPPPPPGSG